MNLKKIIIALTCISIAHGAFAESVTEKITKAKSEMKTQLSAVSDSLLKEFEVILPETNSLSGIQPDAYIGKVFPSVPPHFAAGINVSITPVNASFISSNFNSLTAAISTMLKDTDAIADNLDLALAFQFPDKLPYPAASVSARVGGLFLPFDIGLWGITTGKIFHNKSIGNSPLFDFEYTSLGADLRYAVIEGKGLFPKISVGAGYQFVRQNVGMSFSKGFVFDSGYQDPDGKPITGAATLAPSINLMVDTHTFFGQIQVSKTILILTPYLGLKALFTTSNCSYKWKYDTFINDEKYDWLSDGDEKQVTHTVSDNGIQTQIFGGLGLNFAIFQTSLNVAYNFSSKLFTGSLGMNIKL